MKAKPFDLAHERDKNEFSLSVDVLENAILTPLEHRGSATGYSEQVRLIGAIYNSDGIAYEKAFLSRKGYVQAAKLNYDPTLQKTSMHVRKGVYGGIWDDNYGHFLLETLSRAWYLKDDAESHIYFTVIPRTSGWSFENIFDWQKDLLNALSLTEERVHFVDEIIKFETLIVPTPGYKLLSWCADEQAIALRFLGSRIQSVTLKDYSGKIWLSRSRLKKGAIAGEEDFEQALKKEGFKIVYPELLSIGEQIQVYEQASFIAGFTGSAFHTFLLTKNQNATILHFWRNNTYISDYTICAKATNFKSVFCNFFIRFGDLTNFPKTFKNVLQDLGKIWKTLYDIGLVKTTTYHDPDLELKLQKLDEETQNTYPQLFKKEKLMNIQTNSQNTTDNQETTPCPPRKITHSTRRIRALTEGIEPQTYLEIGVHKGETFLDISIPQKTAVDPKFLFDASEISDNNVELKETTSDEFFSLLPIMKKYDVIFIDGLHTFEQTYRDICNSLLHSHDRTVILIDDTKPCDVYSTIPHQGKALSYRRRASTQDKVWNGAWHGDVFKAVFAIHDFHPALNYRTIVGSGNPQTLLWHSNNGWRKPLFNSLEKISRLTYFDLLDHIDILRECSEEEAINLCLNELASF